MPQYVYGAPAAAGMRPKSSLTVCFGMSSAFWPKWAVNAAATRSVTAVSLSSSGKLATVSNSGSRGDPEAWHSPRTIRLIASSMRCRVGSE